VTAACYAGVEIVRGLTNAATDVEATGFAVPGGTAVMRIRRIRRWKSAVREPAPIVQPRNRPQY